VQILKKASGSSSSLETNQTTTQPNGGPKQPAKPKAQLNADAQATTQPNGGSNQQKKPKVQLNAAAQTFVAASEGVDALSAQLKSLLNVSSSTAPTLPPAPTGLPMPFSACVFHLMISYSCHSAPVPKDNNSAAKSSAKLLSLLQAPGVPPTALAAKAASASSTSQVDAAQATQQLLSMLRGGPDAMNRVPLLTPDLEWVPAAGAGKSTDGSPPLTNPPSQKYPQSGGKRRGRGRGRA
jgi:hypothetical protein